ncbi:MAG: GlsB/YeaQ/YmgE family stress response membrane protein [Gemmataceae bacterium]|nr:GlsB/YeaQ/YmgE family stress response membrane protein [Gemmataceae bacterium]MCI0742830.1 GlsB/YeaQ/YmgE family stress response membrane protein [Gemmataceae bacterium]
MTIVEILLLLFVAALVGMIGQALSGYSVGGLIASIVVGFIGALLGVTIARAMNLSEPVVLQIGEVTFPVVWSIVGATVLILIIGLLRRPYRRA